MRLTGPINWVRIFLLLVVIVVIWICVLLSDTDIKLNLHLHQVDSVNYSVSQSANTVLDPDKTFYEEVERSGNIPLSYATLYKNTEFNVTDQPVPFGLAVNCSRRPSLANIKFNSNFWQMVMTKDGVDSTDVSAYSAYLDTRLKGQSIIRIFINSQDYLLGEMRKPNFCQIWFPGISDPVISELTNIDYIWGLKPVGNNHPLLVTCKLPQRKIRHGFKYFFGKDPNLQEKDKMKLNVFPESVSLVEEKCEKASNNLRLNYKVPAKKGDFGICVRWLDFPTQDLSLRLIEWIEMMTILGAGGIHFHLFAVHPNVLKVLKYYEKLGRVTTKEFSLPGYQPNFPQMRHHYMYHNLNNITHYNYREPMWRQEVIPLNDCFYTHMYTYKYIAAIDIDEVILPIYSKNWKELLTELKVSAVDTPCFKMVVFSENKIKLNISKSSISDLSSEKSVTSHVQGSPPYMMTQIYSPEACNRNQNSKCFFNTENVLLVHNHKPLQCLQTSQFKPCQLSVDTKLAYVHHHRKVCNLKKTDYNKTKENFQNDYTIRKYNEQLILRRDNAIYSMNINTSWN